LTLLISKVGWIAANRLGQGDTVFGADRHGAVVGRAVSLSPSRSIIATAFLGTSAAFGEFSSVTRILTHDGASLQLSQLIESDGIGDARFETLTHIEEESNWRSTEELVWSILSGAAAGRDSNRIAIKCRKSLADMVPGLTKIRQFGGSTYSLLDRSDLRDALIRAPRATLSTIGELWLRNDDDARLELERAFHPFAPIYAAVLRQEGKGYRFQYDSLQHTAYIFICDAEEPPPPVGKVGCACYGTSRGDEFLIEWKGTDWNPIASGFLLASE